MQGRAFAKSLSTILSNAWSMVRSSSMFEKIMSGAPDTQQAQYTSAAVLSSAILCRQFQINQRSLSFIAAADIAPHLQQTCCKEWDTRTSFRWPAAGRHGKNQTRRSK